MDEVTVLALCEQDVVILKPDQLYKFVVDESCEKCKLFKK